MAKDGKNVRAIERELAEHFASLCLDNHPERIKIARWIAKREEGVAAAAPPVVTRAANDPAGTLPALTIAEAGPAPSGFGLHRIPVYDVRLVQSRRPLMLPYRLADNPDASARAFHSNPSTSDVGRGIASGERSWLAASRYDCSERLHFKAVACTWGREDTDLPMVVRSALPAIRSREDHGAEGSPIG